MTTARFQKAILEKDFKTIDEILEDEFQKFYMMEDVGLSPLAFIALVGDVDVFRYVCNKPSFAQTTLPIEFFNSLFFNNTPMKRAGILKFLLEEKRNMLNYGVTEIHLRAALGDASVLDEYNVQDEYLVLDKEYFTVLHYALISGYAISKDPKILEKMLEHEDYTIKAGNSFGTTFLFQLGVFHAFDTITDLLNRYPNHIFSIKSIESNASHFKTMSVVWLLAYRRGWSVLKQLLARDKNTIVDLWMYPHYSKNISDQTLSNILLTQQQWDILEECLLRDPKQYISLAKKIGDEKLSDYLKRHKQSKLLKILQEREEKDKQRFDLLNAYNRKLRELIKSNNITIEKLDKLIELGANPKFDYPTNINYLFEHDRLDIIKHLLIKHKMKLSNLALQRDKGDFLLMILCCKPATRKEFCQWLLENDRYKEYTEGLPVEHLQAMLGQFNLKLEDHAFWPIDNYGLTPYHYMWMVGINASSDPIALQKQFCSMPKTYDIITVGPYKGCHLPHVLADIDCFTLLTRVLELDEDRVYDVTITGLYGTSCLYMLAAKEQWKLFFNIWSRDPDKPVLETIPNEYYMRERIKLSLILAERAISLFETMVTANTTQYVNLNESFPPNHSYEGITLALLLAFYQKWEILSFLFDKHKDPIDLEARPLKRDTRYGNHTLRQLLKIHHQDELLKRLEKNAKTPQKKPAKIKKTDKKPIVLTQSTDIPKQPLTRREEIEAKLISLLTGIGLQARYQQEGKKIIITLDPNQEGTKLDDDQKNVLMANRKKFMAKLLSAKNLKGNEAIVVDVDSATIKASSEGAMYSFFNNAKVLAELNDTSKTASTITGDNFVEDKHLMALALTKEQQEQWQRALVAGFCDGVKVTDIAWDSDKRCFIIPITPGEWQVKDYKSAHQAYERYVITAEFLKEKIVSKIEIFLAGTKDKDRSVYGKTIYQDGCLIIIPYVAKIPQLSTVQQSLYYKISKKCQKVESVPAITKKGEISSKASETEADKLTRRQSEPKQEGSAIVSSTLSETDTALFTVTADNIKELLNKVTVDFEFKFLYEKERINKDKQCQKVIFTYNCQGAFFINGQLSVHLLLAVRGAFDEFMPGFMHVYRHDEMVIVSFNLTKAIDLNAKQIASLQAGFSEQMASFLQNPIKQASVSTSNNLVKLTLHALPKKQKAKCQKGKEEKVETEAEVFATIKSSIQGLSPKVQNNVMYHLNRTKKLKRADSVPESEYAYLLHIMQIFGALESRHIEDGLFYKFRNLTRHVVDESQPETACANLCDQAEPLLKLLQQYFLPASITHISVSVFAPNKSNALETIRIAVDQFASALEAKTLSEVKDGAACLNHHLRALENIHKDGIPDKNHPDYAWKRDATLMLCALIEEITRDGTYREIYRLIGHEYRLPYESMADGLYATYSAQLFQTQTALSSGVRTP